MIMLFLIQALVASYLFPSSHLSGTFLNDKSGEIAKQLFFNNPLFSDVTFEVEGRQIAAHKIVITTRFDKCTHFLMKDVLY